jgi:predicted Rossmann fold flavoprotein
MNNIYDVLVIGGGASGMMAAIIAAQNGASVLLIEKNKRLGEKLRITGGGRCNIYNAEQDLKIYLKNYGKAEQFLYSAFTKFGTADTVAFFDAIKLPTKVEAKNRAFPVTERAVDVVHALTNKLHRLGVTCLTNTTVSRINSDDNTITAVQCGGDTYKAKSYILATGGTSRPETGSTGDGLDWLRQLKHDVKTPTPTITPLALKDPWVSKLAGITAKSVTITFYADGKHAFKLTGDILFTHFGISGPLILNNAYLVADLLDKGAKVTASIDCVPGIDIKTLDTQVIQALNKDGIKQLKNVLSVFVPAGLNPAIKETLKHEINFELKASEVNKQTRKLIVDNIKALPLKVDKLMGFEKAVVADGGINLKDIDTRTMQSKKIANLYITGDLLDINRPSGGYSLQLCWTTGYIAGLHSATSM